MEVRDTLDSMESRIKELEEANIRLRTALDSKRETVDSAGALTWYQEEVLRLQGEIIRLQQKIERLEAGTPRECYTCMHVQESMPDEFRDGDSIEDILDYRCGIADKETFKCSTCNRWESKK